MGATQSTCFNLSQYHYIESITDPIIGHGKLYQNNETGEIVCVMEKLIQQSKSSMKPFQFYEHPNLLKVYEHKIQNITDLCATFTKQSIIYEYTNQHLIDNVKHRLNKKIPFSQQQLWGLLKQGLSVLAYLKEQGIYPMDLKNMMISNQGLIKLHSIQSAQISNYLQILNNCTDEIHISPEELECLKNSQYSLNLDYEKCQIFQLGLTCLYCASLQDTNSLFDLKAFQCFKNEIQSRILNLDYSVEYKNTISQMLDFSPWSRGTFFSLICQIKNETSENNLLRLIKLEGTSQNRVILQPYSAPSPLIQNQLNLDIPRYQQNQVFSLQSSVPQSNYPSSHVPQYQKLLHIATPEQSRISKLIPGAYLEQELKRLEVQNRSDNNLYKESRPTLNTQHDDNNDAELSKKPYNKDPQRQQFYEQYGGDVTAQQKQSLYLDQRSQQPVTINPSNYYYPINQKLLGKQTPFSNALSQTNRDQIKIQKQSIVSQASNISDIENRVEQALRSSKMALQNFDQTISSSKKIRQQ